MAEPKNTGGRMIAGVLACLAELEPELGRERRSAGHHLCHHLAGISHK